MLDHVIRALALKDQVREGWLLRGVRDPESVGDHSWGTAYLCLLYGEEAGVDVSRAVSMAVVHDLAEAVTGDVPTRVATMNDTHRREAKARRERAAMEALFAPVGSGQAPQSRRAAHDPGEAPGRPGAAPPAGEVGSSEPGEVPGRPAAAPEQGADIGGAGNTEAVGDGSRADGGDGDGGRPGAADPAAARRRPAHGADGNDDARERQGAAAPGPGPDSGAAVAKRPQAARRVRDLWEEYEAGTTAVARFVRDMNLIDMCAQAFCYERDGRYDHNAAAGANAGGGATPEDGAWGRGGAEGRGDARAAAGADHGTPREAGGTADHGTPREAETAADQDESDGYQRLDEFFATTEPRLSTALGRRLFADLYARYRAI